MDLAKQRLAQQHLVGRACARPEDAVESLLAVQSQDYAGARWALAQRCLDADDAAVQRAFQEGRILRTHVLRPTWHCVAPADLRWLLALTAPRVHAQNAYYYRQHGLDAALAKRHRKRLVAALGSGTALTRDELGAVLGTRGTPLCGEPLASALMWAELDACICSGPMRGKQHTYVLFEARVPDVPQPSRDEALARIAERYVEGHGPAQDRDLAWWSGLSLTDARRGFDASRSRLEQAVIDGKTYWFSSLAPVPRRRGPIVHLLPNYDELLIAFKDRSAALDPRIKPISSVLGVHFVVVGGRIVGGWRRDLGKSEVHVRVQLLCTLSAPEQRALHQAAARYARSLALELRLDIEVVAGGAAG